MGSQIRMSQGQWSKLSQEVSQKAVEIAKNGNDKPSEMVIESTIVLVNSMSYLLEDNASRGFASEAILLILTIDAPVLVLRNLAYIGVEERIKYTACMMEVITKPRNSDLLKVYIQSSRYLHYLLALHNNAECAKYCGAILTKLMEQASIRDIVINNTNFMELLKALESNSFLVQLQSLRTLQKCFNTGQELPYNKAVCITKAVIKLISYNEPPFLECEALETLAELICTQSQIRKTYLPSSVCMIKILNRLLSYDGIVQEAALTCLSCQWNHAMTSFTKLAVKLNAIQTGEKPCDEVTEAMINVLNEMHFLTMDPRAPALKFHLYQGLCEHFFRCNLPTLILPHLGLVGFVKYTAVVKMAIDCLSKSGFLKAYIYQSTYVDDLWVRYPLLGYESYCGDILLALVEQPTTREIMIKKADVMQLLKLLDSVIFEVQIECLKALKKKFSRADWQLPKVNAQIATDKLLNLTFNNIYFRVRCMALEALTVLVYTHAQIRKCYLHSSIYMKHILGIFFHGHGRILKAALAFLSVYFQNEGPLPWIIRKHRSEISNTVRWCVENGVYDRLYCPVNQIYARLG